MLIALGDAYTCTHMRARTHTDTHTHTHTDTHTHTHTDTQTHIYTHARTHTVQSHPVLCQLPWLKANSDDHHNMVSSLTCMVK